MYSLVCYLVNVESEESKEEWESQLHTNGACGSNVWFQSATLSNVESEESKEEWESQLHTNPTSKSGPWTPNLTGSRNLTFEVNTCYPKDMEAEKYKPLYLGWVLEIRK